jgi:putative ABC transport system permease protein
MNIIRRLTQKYLKNNRSRTLVTIVGVIISTAMITAIPTLMMSFFRAMQQNAIHDYGNWHVRYENINLEKADYLAKDSNTAWVSLFRLDGFSKLENSRSPYNPYLVLMSIDKNTLGTYGIQLEEGRFPVNQNEAVISVDAYRLGGFEGKIGDKLTLEIGRRFALKTETEPEFELGYEHNYLLADEGKPPLEELRPVSVEEVTIVGLIKRPPIETFLMPGFSVFRYLDQNELAADEPVSALVTWKQINTAANKRANLLGKQLGISSKNIVFNTNLLRLYGILSVENLTTIYLLVSVLLVIILIGSVFLISNAFSISVVERSRQFGMLASVGATPAQKKQAIYSEAWLIALIAIPIGIVLGIIGIMVTLKFVEPLINAMMNESRIALTVTVTPGIVTVSALLSLITILLSAMVPARRAARVSPIEAIRQTQDIKIKANKIRSSRLVRWLFGFEGDLALRGIKRNSKGYVITILSLIISIVLFLTVFSLAQYGFGAVGSKVVEFKYPVTVAVRSDASEAEIAEFYRAVEAIPEVTDSLLVQTCYGTIVIAQNKLPPQWIHTDPWAVTALELKPGEQLQAVRLQVIDDIAFDRFMRENKIDLKYSKGEPLPVLILNPEIKFNQAGKIIKRGIIAVQEGDQFDLELTKWNTENENSDRYVNKITIAGLLQESPIEWTFRYDSNQIIVLTSKSIFSQWNEVVNIDPEYNWEELMLATEQSAVVASKTNDLQISMGIGDTIINDRVAFQRAEYNTRKVINIFFYGFVVLIALIGITNILNTILTGIHLRSREFAMLRSVGMTPGSFNKMLRFESLYCGLYALMYGLPLGIGLNYVFFRIVKRSFLVTFEPPWLAIGIVMIVVLIVTMAAMQFSSKKAKQANIVETLRKEAF